MWCTSRLNLVVLFVTASFSFAQTDDTSIEAERPARKEHSRGKHSRKYSKTLSTLIYRAGRLDIDENKKAELIKIRDEYVFVIIKEEDGLMRAHAAIMKSLSNADFKASKVKKEVKNAQVIEHQIIYKYIDGLSVLRETIGNEDYNDLFTKTRGMKKHLEAIREREKKRLEEGKEEAPE